MLMQPRRERAALVRRLSPVAWAVAATGCASSFVLPGRAGGAPVRVALVVTSAVFFTLLVVRLLATAGLQPSRRGPLLCLAAGTALWAAGSATVSASQAVNASQSLQMVAFPAPGEALFLASYLGIAAFLLLEVPRPPRPTTAVVLEAVVLCGAAACGAAFVLLTPLSRAAPVTGLTLLLATLYPVIDLLLGVVVLAQISLRQRRRDRRGAALVLGFLALAAADSTFVLGLAREVYTTSILAAVLWGAGFAAIVSAACSPTPDLTAHQVPRRPGGLLLAAAATAVVVLVVHPRGSIGWLVTATALITLSAAGVRMLLALREAHGAAEAMRLSLTDELTGLSNRRALLAEADRALATGAVFGLMLLDLDGFKHINDSAGHSTGDAVLTAVGRRLRASLGDALLVARLGGDEFAVLAAAATEVELLELAHHVRSVLRHPLRVDGLDLSIDASIGVTVRQGVADSSAQLLRRADIAMYEAKQARVGALLFDSSQDGHSAHRLRRGEELRLAIQGSQLRVWYQPQVDAKTCEVVALEALVRWEHPSEGLLSPVAFLTEARAAGLMPALSNEVLQTVLADARAWRDAGHTFRVALNCAPPELLGETFLPALFAGIARFGLPPDALMVEVTEDLFMRDPERAREALDALHAHHVQTAIDDYGTGFSSLTYLRDLPVRELKLDRSFLSGGLRDDRSRMIVDMTAKLAHALDLRLVAEGVEDALVAAELVAMNIDVLQGYHVARPMPAHQVQDWVSGWTTHRGFVLPRS